MSKLILGVFVVVVCVAWAFIDAESFNANWWLILPVAVGATIFSAMLKNKSKD